MAVGDTRYLCGDEERRAALVRLLEASDPGAPPLNGIDFLEVLDGELVESDIEELRQRILLVQCYSTAGLAGFRTANIRIRGGARVTGLRGEWVVRLADTDAGVTDPDALARLADVPEDVVSFLRDYRPEDGLPRERILAVGTGAPGDFSTYTLSVVDPDNDEVQQEDFDPRLAAVDFSFKVECPSDFDCAVDEECPAEPTVEPQLDYLAKDYDSFRRLMLDRMSAVAPDWRERSPADLGVVLVELLAHVGDELSYAQDAVATEAYLGTARQRVSVRRHARLVDYLIHEGVNARAWVAFEVEAASNADGAPLEGSSSSAPGTRLLTRSGGSTLLTEDEARKALDAGALAFETLLPVTLRAQHNEISFYTWSDRACCLPAGATSATLLGDLGDLKAGDHLVFEEVRGPRTGSAADADPAHRHVVRLTAVEHGFDPVMAPPLAVTEVHWHAADAPSFPLCLSAVAEDGTYLEDVSVARGNVTLADHGLTLDDEDLGEVAAGEAFRPRLEEGPLTHAVPLPEGYVADTADPEEEDVLPAAELAAMSPRAALPAVRLREDDGTPWEPQRDLLASGAFSREVVAEIQNDGRARLRFGDGTHGFAPAPGARFTATYRAGNGPEGNVGSGAIAHVVDAPTGITRVRNPLPAFGGEAAESLEEVRRYAPQAFRVQERAVTALDWARAAERHPEVERATASFRWTGSWYTVFLTLDRESGLEVDATFEARIREYLEAYRLAGWDLEVEGPRFVPLELEIFVCLAYGYHHTDVARTLMAALSNRELPDGARGLFHPDRWSFGQAVDLSRIYGAASGVDGVASLRVTRFARRGQPAGAPEVHDRVAVGRREIARLDNDPNRPENGRITLKFGGAA